MISEQMSLIFQQQLLNSYQEAAVRDTGDGTENKAKLLASGFLQASERGDPETQDAPEHGQHL